MKPQLYDPYAHAEQMGVRIVYHPLRVNKGFWVPDQGLILCRPNMKSFVERAVLAHECAHAEAGDPAGHHPRNEHRANLLAAQRLIDPREWSALTNAYGDYDRICIELGITREQFLAYHQHRIRRAA